MPTSQHTTPERRSPKSSHLPAKTTHIAPKTALAAPICPHDLTFHPYSNDRK